MRSGTLVLVGLACSIAAALSGRAAEAHPSNFACHRVAKVESCEGQLDHHTIESLLATVRMLGDGGMLRARLVMAKDLGLDPLVTARFTPDLQILTWDALDSTDRIAIHAPLQREGDMPLVSGCFRIVFASMHERGGDSTAQSWSWDLYPSPSC